MYCIVPLAGPDFFNNEYGIRPLIPYDDGPLFESILKRRSWFQNLFQIIFILKEMNEHTQAFVDIAKKCFSHSQFVTLSTYSRGALLSSLAGASIITNYELPVIVDLIDIDYGTSDLDPKRIFATRPEIKGILPYFQSNESCYSYLDIDSEGFLVRSVEKAVISSRASAGTYFFKNLATFLSVHPGSVAHHEQYSYKDNLFLCPAFNEIVRQGEKVLTQEVKLIRSISKEMKVFAKEKEVGQSNEK